MLEKRATAKVAIVKADADRRLRRALLRRYAGSNTLLEPGQSCYYWRDARQADLVKIRWLGPATVILREDDPTSGRPHLYWIAHVALSFFGVPLITFELTFEQPIL